MNSYCKILINEFAQGTSMFEVCERPGMPSMNEVRRWLFNREYHYEYAGFRENFLYILKRVTPIHFDEIEIRREKYTKAAEANSPDANQLSKEFYDYLTAAQWQFRSVPLLEKLYAAHEKGEDFLIEGEHYCKILEPLPALPPLSEEEKQERAALRESRKADRQKALESGDYMAFAASFSASSGTSKTLLRAEAEKIIGSPLLYGRYQKREKARRKAKIREKNCSMVRANSKSIQEKHSVPKERIEHKINAEKVSLHTVSVPKNTIPTSAGIPPAQRNLSEQIIKHIQSAGDGASTSSATGIQSKNISDIPHPTFDIHLNRFQKQEIGKASPRPGESFGRIRTGGSNYTKPKKKRKRR